MLYKPYRILSLDGGGTFCLAQARALQELFGPDMPGRQVLSQFQLAAGTSGGSFVIAALVADLTPGQIVRLFQSEQNRQRFFCKLPWYERLLSVLTMGDIGCRFSMESKRDFMASVVGTNGPRKMSELADERGMPELLIVGYDYQFDRAKLLRSRSDSGAANFPRNDGHISLLDAINLSTHAPLNWFGGLASAAGSNSPGFWDGALTGFNNPVQLAASEAIANGVPRDAIGVLSLGSGNCMLLPWDADCDPSFKVKAPRPCLRKDLRKVARAIIAEPPDADSYLAHLSLSAQVPRQAGQACESPIIRCSPLIHPRREGQHWEPPKGFASPEEFGRLVDMDIAATADEDVRLIELLCDNWISGASQNQAVRRAGGYFSLDANGRWNEQRCCEIGYARFADAKAAWASMSREPAVTTQGRECASSES